MSNDELTAFWFGIVNGLAFAVVLALVLYAIQVNVDWI